MEPSKKVLWIEKKTGMPYTLGVIIGDSHVMQPVMIDTMTKRVPIKKIYNLYRDVTLHSSEFDLLSGNSFEDKAFDKKRIELIGDKDE